MGDALVAKFGQLWDFKDIPGSPTPVTIAEKEGVWWFSGITENIEGSDTSVSTNRYTRTWTFRLQ
jgi:hypothetical protein